ncbi:MAG: hypothetical protein KBG15_12570 [Kofleriaceae bacterium]|nr:hypothetical protein [Kofleriaceae bacterium]
MKNTTLFAATLITVTLSAVAVAQADDAGTTVVSATNTVVVVTPNQPVVVGGTAAPAAPAASGPSTVAPAGGPGVAPITNPDISQINGQLVPVGTHNEYHYSFRKTLIAANPIGWLMGVYGVSVSHALSNNIAVRGDVTAYVDAFGETGNNALEFGISAPIYLRRTYQGPFVEPGLAVRTYTNDTCDYYSSSPGGCSTTTESQTGPQVLVGYHVSYDSGFSMAAAFGIQRNLTSTSEYGGDEILPAGYFRVGYAF